jgi:hypothetical protein
VLNQKGEAKHAPSPLLQEHCRRSHVKRSQAVWSEATEFKKLEARSFQK